MIKLTKRQQVIEDLLFEGLSCKEIAYNLNISFVAVASQKQEIFRKRNVRSIGELLAMKIKQLKDEIKYLETYKQKWEHLKQDAFLEKKAR